MTTISIPPATSERIRHQPSAPPLDRTATPRRGVAATTVDTRVEWSLAAVVRELSHAFASPVEDAADRRRRRQALGVLMGDAGLGAPRLVPTSATPDVVVDRIAGWALVRLDGRHRAAALAARTALRAG
ncbi:MAG TPA: hypothetical protein VJ978_13435 [Nitriliruptoraceae bacterium]|nr:hypothetical protein [Nitriliruptoraceae bacterium]